MTQHTITYDDAARGLFVIASRLEAEAEEFEGPDGTMMAVALDYWHPFAEALEAVRKTMGSAAPKPEAVSRTALSEGPVKPVARLHITSTDTYPDIEVEVLDGSTLQPEMSPVNIYTAPPASRTVPSDAEISKMWTQTNEDCPLTHEEAAKITAFVDAPMERYGQPLCSPDMQRESQRGSESQPVFNQSTEREAFEAAFAKSPFEWGFARYGEQSAWPGNYQIMDVQCAWEAWQARAALAQQPGGQPQNGQQNIPEIIPDSSGAQDKPLIINGYQLREALEFVAPDGDTDQLEQLVCIQYGPARDHDDGHDQAGLFCWLEACPDEGSIPLDEEPTCASSAPGAQDREDAERYLWATANEDNAEVLNSIVICYDGDQAKINERVDVYRTLLARYGSSQPVTNEALLDLVSRLRALARYQHDDMSVADEAADALLSGQPANFGQGETRTDAGSSTKNEGGFGQPAAEAVLRKILQVVQRYLPPDGPSAEDAMGQIIALVDPWPLSGQPAASVEPHRCEDCPPVGYPTDETRCAPCDRRADHLVCGRSNGDGTYETVPAASVEPRPDEYDYFVDWYDNDAPSENEVRPGDMARYAWLAGVRFADRFPAAAPVAQEPVAWFTDDNLTDKSATTWDAAVAERWRTKGWPVNPLYAGPVAVQAQPSGNAGESPDAREAFVAWLSGEFPRAWPVWMAEMAWDNNHVAALAWRAARAAKEKA